MKLEQSERLFVEELFEQSVKKKGDLGELKDVIRLTGDASTRRYYRIETSKKSYVICIDGPSDKDCDFDQMQCLLEEHGVRVPMIHDKRNEFGYLLEEDLGDVTLLSKLAGIDKEEEFVLYKKAIEELVKIHSIDIELNAPFRERYFDFDKLNQETNMTHNYFVLQYLKNTNEQDQVTVKEEFEKINSYLEQGKQVVCHRDYHSRNLMLKGNEMIVIDFQDARIGLPQYDLVSLLEDCYYKINEDNKAKLIRLYIDRMNFSEDDLEEFYRAYDYSALQRIYKAIGSFCYINFERKDSRYLKYVGYSFEGMKTILQRRPELNDLYISLSKIYYES
ncbi:phosphotransferase [Halobacteriovorax sp. GB3]|uniref:aminoglycoside phosphotransferase family protein n=1 Tax=Halobacteriovorax sp. GB3 TaxID=2719615 RepID=UPI002360F950|nr:phosphotransferase [Halobacteriovorax sp. GB3]MDD0854788.1 phosphotransferase [Halobacteriovorax sp. GB3]